MKQKKVRREKISLVEFMKQFPTEESARAQFEEWRWGDQKRCAHCDSVRISEAKNQKMPYRCKDCRRRFSPKTGTVMANSNLTYHTWLLAIYIAATGLKGTASTKLGSDVGCTQKSAWHLGQRIRKAWEREQSIVAGTVEVDESYFGSKERNKHSDKKLRAGRSAVGKTAVVGMKDRDTNEVNAEVVDHTNRRTLQGFVIENTTRDAKVYTDKATAYMPCHAGMNP